MRMLQQYRRLRERKFGRVRHCSSFPSENAVNHSSPKNLVDKTQTGLLTLKSTSRREPVLSDGKTASRQGCRADPATPRLNNLPDPVRPGGDKYPSGTLEQGRSTALLRFWCLHQPCVSISRVKIKRVISIVLQLFYPGTHRNWRYGVPCHVFVINAAYHFDNSRYIIFLDMLFN